MKKVYFACSIAGGRDHAHVYQDIVNYIKKAGAEVISELFVDKSIDAIKGSNPEMTPNAVWSRDVEWVKSSDALVVEATQPSLGVGYEIAIAESLKKPILALFHKDSGRRLSSMIAGNPHVEVFEYSDITETQAAIRTFLA